MIPSPAGAQRNSAQRASAQRAFARRGQSFALDLILGLLITTATIVSVVLFLPRNEPPFIHDTERLSVLMTEGVPPAWNATSVTVPGLLTDDRFNLTKIQLFEAMTYTRQKSLLGLRGDFTVRFANASGPLALCSTCGTAPVQYKNVLPVRRVALLGSDIVTMEVTLYS